MRGTVAKRIRSAIPQWDKVAYEDYENPKYVFDDRIQNYRKVLPGKPRVMKFCGRKAYKEAKQKYVQN